MSGVRRAWSGEILRRARGWLRHAFTLLKRSMSVIGCVGEG
jgi:hypothetical protein